MPSGSNHWSLVLMSKPFFFVQRQLQSPYYCQQYHAENHADKTNHAQRSVIQL
jgi:hypothetical protein